MKRKLRKNIHRLKHSVSQRSLASITKRRSIRSMAEKLGLVYFGSVNQHMDEHSVTRGFTASATHLDDNYCVGSLEGYDISFVQRTDFLDNTHSEIQVVNWFILEVDLQNSYEMPHFLLRSKHESVNSFDLFFHSNPSHRQVLFGNVNHPNHDFVTRYELFAKPTQSINVESLFDQQFTTHVAAHLWPHSAEISGNKLYVYYSTDTLNKAIFEAMLRAGLWAAKTLDQKTSLLAE